MLYQSDLFCLDYREKERLLLPQWTGKELSAETFMDTMLQYRLLMGKTKAQRVLWDHTHFTFSIPEQLYHWIEAEINQPAKVHGMNRICFLLGEDVMAQFTTMDCFETTHSIYTPQYFADPHKAMQWIKEKKRVEQNPFEKEIQLVMEKWADKGKANIRLEVNLEQLPYYLKQLKGLFQDQSFGHQNYQKFRRLSERERQVLRLMTEGLSTKTIAEKLFIAPMTISTHRRNIIRKLECRSISELVRFKLFFVL